MYFVQPIYVYTVDGHAYRSDRIVNAIGGCANTEAGARKSLEENYPLKASVTVYYDPNHPAAAFLRKGEASTAEAVMVGILIVLPVAILLGLRGVKFRVQLDRGGGTAPDDAVPSAQRKVVFRKTFSLRLGKKNSGDGPPP